MTIRQATHHGAVVVSALVLFAIVVLLAQLIATGIITVGELLIR
ncbi:hypothetical protein [Sphingomonas sp.]|jgi:hypothetical protein